MDLSALSSREFQRTTFEGKLRLILELNPNMLKMSRDDAATALNANDEVMAALSGHGIPKLGAHHIEMALTGDIQPPTTDADGNTITREWRDGRMTMTITAPDGAVRDVIEQEQAP